MNLKVLEQAFQRISLAEMQESQRLLHGRGRCYPGFEQLAIDWFEPVIVITLYKENTGFDLKLCCDLILKHFSTHFASLEITAIVFQNRAPRIAETKVVWGELPETVFAREQVLPKHTHLRFHLDILNHQNSGYFLDANYARKYLAREVSSKKVLNLFSYTCAFSVAALAAGAQSVVNLDMGRGVLERGRLNHELNKLDMRCVQFIKSDIFKSWKKLHKYGRYDWIIIDPPSFQKGSFNAEKDYLRVVKNLGKLLASEAKIMACLNSPFLSEAFLDALFLEGALNTGEHSCEKVERLANPPAFKDVDPDAGLKVVVYSYSRKIF